MANSRKHPKYEAITSRWGGMDVRHEFSKRIDDWLSAFDETDKPLLLSLLGQFYYYSEKRLKEKAKLLFEAFSPIPTNEVEPVYTSVIKEYGAGFSSLFWSAFWLINDLYLQAEENILGLLENGEVPSCIVIVDDYSGTGGTLVSTLQKMVETNENILNSDIYILVIHITQRAKVHIEEYSKSVGAKITIISLEESEEAFSGGYLFELVEAERKRLEYEAICHRKGVSMELGFEEVQSLVAFHYNTPNNTLGLFWKDLDGFAALFPRKKKEKTTLAGMQRRAAERQRQRQNPPVLFGIEEKQLVPFMEYCLRKDKGFSFEDAKIDFGFTVEQLKQRIKAMTELGYISNSGGKFAPTAKLKSKMFNSRLNKQRKRNEVDLQPEKAVFNADVKYIPKDF